MLHQYLIIGLLIGLVFGMPVGAVGALSIQRTMNQGIGAGLISGTASSIADMLYACVGAFGLTFITDFLLQYKLLINLIGALLLILMAIKMIMNKDKKTVEIQMDAKGYIGIFISSFVIAITNPAAILSFLFAFSIFGINGSLGLMNGVQLIVGIFIGTFLWWLLLVFLTSYMKHKLKNDWYGKVNKLFGAMLLLFGIGVIIKAF